ncbi:hypothetical protein HO133_010006 [Letharia lupina]|uniref:Heterokaryon incompatibility domain-containing protein n=1 Tax=Letharia lupina TaxID=560253 RepID=A0A8H6FDT4_9LECA|nr:uncharacterized protein HO133_010006 [Letharia lupina]KAF6224812.1 hypothetical protein HO133_010006 [Letharia lupina]
MDHLPVPKCPQNRPQSVLCLAQQDFDGGDFDTYPERAGWGERSRKEWAVEFQRKSPEFQGFLHTWRFFGLTSTLLTIDNGRPPRISDLTRHTTAGRIIDTSKLPGMLETFIRNNSLSQVRDVVDLERLLEDINLSLVNPLQTMDDQIRRHKFNNRLSTILTVMLTSIMNESRFRRTQTACDCSIDPSRVESLNTFINNAVIVDPLPVLVQDSIDLLLDALTSSFLPKHPQKYLNELSVESISTYAPVLSQTLRSQSIHISPRSSVISNMIKNGWCPSLTSQLRQRFGISALVFISNLERPDSLMHGACSEVRCAFDKVDQKNYIRAHADGCAGAASCFDVCVDKAEMHETLKNDRFPIINVINQNNNLLSMNISGSESTKEYVAISHVWSDGLGNPKANAIPHCQLQALGSMVTSLPVPTSAGNLAPFWLDTICCPIEESKDQEAAIRLMRDTYEKASVVLVLDSSTLTLSTTDMNGDVEILMRIFRSRWTTRLWTLQEGALAQRLFVQFANGPYDMQEGIKRIQKNADMSMEYTVIPTILKEFLELRVFQIPSMSTEQKLTAISRALQFRATSVETDEPLCLATLLGFDTQTIMATPPKERMQRFWDSMSGIPPDILFLDSSRMSEDRYKWAPRSFLRTEADGPSQTRRLIYHDYTESVPRFANNGLQLTAPVIKTAFHWNRPVGNAFYIFALKDDEMNGDWYWIRTNMSRAKAAEKYSQPFDRCDHVQECLRMLPPVSQPKDRILIIMLKRQKSIDVMGETEGFLLYGTSTTESISAQPIEDGMNDAGGGRTSSNGKTTATPDASIMVHETGEKMIQVPGNANSVMEKTFDVKPRSSD